MFIYMWNHLAQTVKPLGKSEVFIYMLENREMENSVRESQTWSSEAPSCDSRQHKVLIQLKTKQNTNLRISYINGSKSFFV